MDQVAMMAMQTCQTYAEKSTTQILTEDEMLLYGQLCSFITTYTRGAELAYRKNLPESEREVLQAEAEHVEWLKAHDKEQEDKGN